MAAKQEDASKRFAALDGVRGLAIILVLCHHFFAHTPTSSKWLGVAFRQLGQGWIGVDLFFVLSGFLITGILMRTRSESHYLKNFFARRFLRISPLYFGVLAVIFCVLLPLGLLQKEPGAPSSSWFWLYGTNFLISRLHHFDLGVVNTPLNHLWSLAVEEHFYLVWPFIVLAINPRRLWIVCLGMISIVVAARSYYVISTHDWVAAYVNTGFRCDSLLIGGLIAAFNFNAVDREKLKRIYLGVFIGTAALMVGCQEAGWLSFGRDTLLMQTGGYTYLAAIFGALVGYLSLAGDRGLLSAGFRLPVLRFFGKYSYGIYMFHPFFLVAVGLQQTWMTPLLRSMNAEAILPLVGASLVLAGSVGLAMLSFRFFENPISMLKHHFEAEPAARLTTSSPVLVPVVPAIVTAEVRAVVG